MMISEPSTSEDPAASQATDGPPPDDPSRLLKRTVLHDLHVAMGARMVPFAGHAMPLHYPPGIIAEHLQVREKAGLFDVSHMGQAFLGSREGGVAEALEELVPSEIEWLEHGQARYTVLLNAEGGIVDDLIVTRPYDEEQQDYLWLIVNAARKEVDFALIREALRGRARLVEAQDRALLALQGPAAASVMARLCPVASELAFMHCIATVINGRRCMVWRSGYTGEDGFEISVPADGAEDIARLLLDQPEVGPAGLGARDSLRLEAGLCLYGQDLNEAITPVEAGLSWLIGKSRRPGGQHAGGFRGYERLVRELEEGTPRKRVGIEILGARPVRAGAAIEDEDGNPIGEVTSGGYSPILKGPIAMGYVQAERARVDMQVRVAVRGGHVAGQIVKMPFVDTRYHRPLPKSPRGELS